MRFLKLFFCIVVFSILLCINNTAYAMNTGFSTEELSQIEIDKFLSNMDISMVFKRPLERTIYCFDVNEEGMIAIGSNEFLSEFKAISVFNADGDFLYGYEFECSGNFGLEWDGENIIIYFVRSNIATSVNKRGQIEELLEIENSIDNNTYWNEEIYADRRNVNNIEYLAQKNMCFLNLFATSSSQLISTNANGDKNVIYDVNDSYFRNLLIMFIAVVALVSIAVIGVWREIKKYMSSSKVA